MNEGNCDSDDQCYPGLKCGSSNCIGDNFDDDDRCCGEKNRSCTGDDFCCTFADPCVLGEGDCDNDDHCVPGLKCGHNNCGGDPFDDDDDCCFDPTLIVHKECNGDDFCCSYDDPCTLGEGDCENDEHCAPGLRCGLNNCDGELFD